MASKHPGEKPYRLNPVARVLIQGLYDEDSDLFRLNGMYHILRLIWKYVISYWKQNIKDTYYPRPHWTNDQGSKSFLDLSYHNLYHPRPPHSCSSVNFPKPSGLNINMMPFVMWDSFEKCRLPEYLKSYWEELIQKCPIGNSDIGRIGYLTIHESFVDENTSQRRPGIHTEKPGKVILLRKVRKGKDKSDMAEGGGFSYLKHEFYGVWGLGGMWRVNTELEGGIFMASTVSKSCRIWDCQITKDDLIGEMGDIEHLREFLPNAEMMTKNHLYWFTDTTPHESLPLEKGTYRQFFRLVTSQVSFWYEDHSTKNPLGVVPDPNITMIVAGSKFDKAGVLELKEVHDDLDQLTLT